MRTLARGSRRGRHRGSRSDGQRQRRRLQDQRGKFIAGRPSSRKTAGLDEHPERTYATAAGALLRRRPPRRRAPCLCGNSSANDPQRPRTRRVFSNSRSHKATTSTDKHRSIGVNTLYIVFLRFSARASALKSDFFCFRASARARERDFSFIFTLSISSSFHEPLFSAHCLFFFLS